MQAEGYGSVNRRIRLRKLKNMTAQAEEYDCVSERRRLIRFKEIEYGVQGDCFWKVATRLSSSAEPSQQVCSLQSAGLPSILSALAYQQFLHFLVRLVVKYHTFKDDLLWFYTFLRTFFVVFQKKSVSLQQYSLTKVLVIRHYSLTKMYRHKYHSLTKV